MARVFTALCLAIVIGSCAAPPRPQPVTSSLPPLPPPDFTVPEPPDVFAALADWSAVDTGPGVEAFRRSCAVLARRAPGEWLSSDAMWAGRVGEWSALCESLALTGDVESARRVIEALTLPVEVVSPDGQARFTGYFEPLIEARRWPEGRFSAPVPGPPGDLVKSGNGPMQRLPSGRLRAYPPRAEIEPEPSRVLGYAHPADVFFLQIQGSGRLRFPDGSTVRAAYFAHNGHPFRSTANWLIRQGEIGRGEASMQGIRAWMDRASPRRVQTAMNANPRYVFFQALAEGDPSLGPAGAMGVPLTPLGSMAVDDELHAYGVPYLVSTDAPGLGGRWSGLLVSQDTGRAIRGAVRGDIYFGTGDGAGARAGTMNAPGRMWALLPRGVAARLRPQAVAGLMFEPVAPPP